VLLEGPAIEPLLAQVRQEYGSGVRIISADKVRSGGIGGFFAKQHYELSVEVPDSTDDRTAMAPRKTTPAPPPPPRAQKPRIEAPRIESPRIESPRAGSPRIEAPRIESPSAEEPPAQTLEQLLERAESRDRIAPHEEPAAVEQVSGRDAGIGDTDERFRADPGAAFAELLAGLDAANHIATSGPARPSPRPKAAAEKEKDKSDAPTVRPFRPAQATGAPVNGGGSKPLPPVPSLAELMGGLGVTEMDPFDAPRPMAPSPSARSAAAAYGLTPPAAPTSGPPIAGVAPTSGAPATSLVPATTSAPPALRSIAHDPVVGNLISVGMPEPMAAQITGGDTYAGVLSALAARPAAPGVPDAAGEILVLAGDLSHAVPIGKQLLEQIGVDQSHLLLAGPSSAGTGLHSSRVLHDAKTAATRAEKLQAADSPWVIVLDAQVGSTDPIWVNDMCDAIGATALWAVVDATRKTADTARHLRTLGEVEALVVHSVELTADPATVLGLDLPIFSLDGKPATPHAWAAMLCARIATDVTPIAAAPRRVARAVRR
jgi:hypothetical protein